MHLSDEIEAAQWRAQRADQEVEQAREVRHTGGSLNFRPSEIVSGAILG